MSLLNLWKSIRGNSPSAGEGNANPSQGNRQRADPAQPTIEPTASQAAAQPAVKRKLAKPTKPKRGFLGLGGPQDAICRLVKRSGATSVLEIGVGNGERALAVTQSLIDANAGTTVRYAAIDRFEMADGAISLKTFHQQLRAQDVQPTLVPMDIAGGLARISSTIGLVDLVLIAEPNEDVDLTALKHSLARITGKNSSVYQLVDSKWEKVNVHVSSQSRRAA